MTLKSPEPEKFLKNYVINLDWTEGEHCFYQVGYKNLSVNIVEG